MDKTKIDWCDSSWNPVTGCLHGCEYCYARGIAERFRGKGDLREAGTGFWLDAETFEVSKGVYETKYPLTTGGKPEPFEPYNGKVTPYPFGFAPTFHRYKLEDYANKTGRNIFVCSMADLFGKWVPDSWIEAVFDACRKAPQHNYLFLTKNPERYIELKKSGKITRTDNFWFGSSVTNSNDRYAWFGDREGIHWFLSMEPILEDLWQLDTVMAKPDWIIVGAETGRRKNKVVPERVWIENLLEECRKYEIPIFMKSSLSEIWGEPLIQEFPDELKGNK